MTFQEARAKLTEISGGKYRAMYYRLTDDHHGKSVATCRVYVDGANNLPKEYPTWKDAIESHIKAQLPPLETVPDVAEMPCEPDATPIQAPAKPDAEPF